MFQMIFENGQLKMKFTLPQDQMNLFKCYEFTRTNYDKIVDYSFCDLDENIHLGDKGVCRFCGDAEGETTFETVAHTIPESLGNKKLFSNDECDRCNSYFGSYIENELAEFLSIFRSIGFVKGKKGRPHQKHYANHGCVTTFHDQRLLRFSTKAGKKMFKDLGDNNAEIQLKDIKIHHHKIMKSFSKIALALMPVDEIQYFDATKEWLFEDSYPSDKFPENSYGMMFIYSKTANKNNLIRAVLLRRQEHLDQRCPYMMIGIYFAHFTFFVPIQFSSKDDFHREHLIIGAAHINNASVDMQQYQFHPLGYHSPTTTFSMNMKMTYETKESIPQDEKE
ncbi:HNH endonuclease [Sulfurimonas sp. HSL-3221]|uniref:HNH endonuclease n=1 Tax=Thiomicrolovo sulfuroxydans TaxID=2894755 RepID=UPI001E48E2B3|nr:HNH endonuclease [Sulfurimonas sp. HSL-3221]UFS61502.1 HNH endonuclease [Sulfurimonas sp. HSL-3221]